MGKNQHSKDQLHVRPTEWAQDGAGYKAKKNVFAKLPLECCFLSLQPFDKPVGTRDGQVFDVQFIIPYIKRFGRNPVGGGRLEVGDLVPLTFHKNVDGQIHCPVTFKAFTNHSHVVINCATGHVYSGEAVEELNRKPKMWKDLITDQPFKWADIVTIQHGDDLASREVAKFYFMVEGQQEEVVRTITHKKAKMTAAEEEEDKLNIRRNPAMQRIYEEKAKIKEAEAAEKAAKAAADALARGDAPVLKGLAPNLGKERKVNEYFTDGEVAESFTSTACPLRKKNVLRLMTEEEDLQEVYNVVRKAKTKAYVRIVTTEGLLNLELHTNIVPRTCDNFLRLCEQEYYNGTIFHRLIHNFMMQGGDPTNTGKGGKSAFEGGKPFRDEFDSRLSHQGPGIVSMANNGVNTNKSQFFISLKSCAHLDNKHSIFGRIVGGLQLLELYNTWQTGEKDRPYPKEIKILRTEVFKNPFRDAVVELSKPQVEKVVEPEATWFSNRRDPMEEHKNRNKDGVGKYLEDLPPPLPGTGKRKPEAVPTEEMEYANVPNKSKHIRTSFDFSTF